MAIRNVTVDKRNTMLKERVQKELGKVLSQPVEEEQTASPSRENWLREDLFKRLNRSRFRMRFKLIEADRKYIAEKGWDTIREHAAQIVEKRLAPAEAIAERKRTSVY